MSALSREVHSNFIRDLKEETQKAIKSAACDQIIEALSPDQEGQPSPSQAMPHDYAEKAIANLAAKNWEPGSVRRIVEWIEWNQKVIKDGQQVANAVEANPEVYIWYLSKPPVRRGVIAWTKYCYARPR